MGKRWKVKEPRNARLCLVFGIKHCPVQSSADVIKKWGLTSLGSGVVSRSEGRECPAQKGRGLAMLGRLTFGGGWQDSTRWCDGRQQSHGA